MNGRENSVIESFRHSLRRECTKVNVVDMNAPANSGDRYWNADEFFAAGDRFFIVEFKSQKFSLKSEDRKPSACTLCGRLATNIQARIWHDMAHFAAWGHKRREGDLTCHIGVYRTLVCRHEVLPSCEHVSLDCNAGSFEVSENFIQKTICGKKGLREPEFTRYLRWLIIDSNTGGGSSGFPIGIYAYSQKHGMNGRLFSQYDDFSWWASTATAVQNQTPISRSNGYSP